MTIGRDGKPGGGRGCSPCCSNGNAEVSPLLPAKPPLYGPEKMRPVSGPVASSRGGFLVSFLVDARGGAMIGHRHWGIRVVLPPGAVTQPTRINCKYQPLSALPYPPPFMEREALASRVLEISPALQSFRSPVLLEIPHFASSAGGEREIVVLRSNDGETWSEHISDTVDDTQIYQDVVSSVVSSESAGDLERVYDVLEVKRGRVVRVLTCLFPKYFAIITRVRQEVRSMDQEGGKLALPQEPRCRATFPRQALHKRIKVGLQVQSLTPDIVKAAFGRSVEVSRIVAVEPRKRKFHQPIFVSIPLPCPASKINNPACSLRLLCSVTGSTEKADWEDMTGSTPLEVNKDVVHFTTKVSALFWILVIHDQQREPKSALSLATRLYEEAMLVPYMVRISMFYRENYPRAWVNTIRIYCMTDDKAEKVINSLHGFRPLASSKEVELPHSAPIAVKLTGNILQLQQDPFTSELFPVSTIRSQFIKEPFIFKSFEENALTLLVQSKEAGQQPSGSLAFYRKLSRITATQQLFLCQLNFNGDTSDENIKEDILFQHQDGNDIQETPPPPARKKRIDEEDVYEKVEVKKTLPAGMTFYKKPTKKVAF